MTVGEWVRDDVRTRVLGCGAAAAPPRTLPAIFAATARRYPDSPAVLTPETALTYAQAQAEVTSRAAALRERGVGPGDRVGVRMPSGTADLYLTILAILAAGAAYVPVDADDPDDRAATVWQRAQVCAVVTAAGTTTGVVAPHARTGVPSPEDDAWVIFTSGSTGTPKGVAVAHRCAAAFVDAEADLFVPDAPLGPGDRVLAGLSVAFDASCEEMWLAWRSGGCLVPAPRALVRAGSDLGPLLRAQRITVVSTVPTLAALWTAESLRGVRLLILGGEACPPEVVDRFDDGEREVWNTYGPTETTVVACATRLRAGRPVTIGFPLPGWEVAVVDPDGGSVSPGGTGELVIGGVGVARYLDPERDRERFPAFPAFGWDRGYRSGDLVRATDDGLAFVGRADDQVKLGGRRVELGEIDAALLALPGVAAAAASVRRTPGGLEVLVGYLVAASDFDSAAATARLTERLPGALVPRLAVLEEFPLRPSGKVDRDALPWPLPHHDRPQPPSAPESMGPHGAWALTVWSELLGATVGPHDDFFALGGTSVAAARLVSVLRERFPAISVADLYRAPTPAALCTTPAEPATDATARRVARVPWWSGWVQAVVQLCIGTVTGLRWLLWVGLLGNVAALLLPEPWLPQVPWWLLAVVWVAGFSPPGRTLLAAGGARLLRGNLRPGRYPRGGRTHLRLWTAERFAAALGPRTLLGTPLAARYARLLGNTVGDRVDLHAPPPVSGLGTFGDDAAVEPEADLAGWWLDGDVLHVGTVEVGARARVGARATLLPGARLGADAELLPGAGLDGDVPPGACRTGTATGEDGARHEVWPPAPAPRRRWWAAWYLASAAVGGLLALLAALPTLVITVLVVPANTTWPTALTTLLAWTPVMVLAGLACHAATLVALVRAAGRWIRPGTHPVDGPQGWAAWFVHGLMQTARRTLFPCYASLGTPCWLRLLGARVGRDVEASTVVALPGLLRVGDRAFLADDVLAAPYELRAGWVRTGAVEVGSGAFVGNSAIVAPDRVVADDALIGVLTDAPHDVPDRSSWLGRPPLRLPRTAESHDPTRTYRPSPRLRAARAAVELCRVVAVLVAGALGLAVFFAFAVLGTDLGLGVAAAAGGVLLCAASLVAGSIVLVAKWLLVGRFRTGRHALWTPFVWRNELYDTFVEVLGVPWVVAPWSGTPVLNWWLRGLGARIGRGAWCETHWLPETDLVTVADGASVNRGCVLQTHLFHDRVMRLQPVHIGAGATLGPHSIALPGAHLGPGATVGAASLMMAGETVPGHTRWCGAPVRKADREPDC